MEITTDAQFKKELIAKIAAREFSDRTGVHSSDLNYCLNKSALRKQNPEEPQEHETLLFSLGWSTQRWLTGQDRDEPEREVDGIKVTCDALLSGKMKFSEFKEFPDGAVYREVVGSEPSVPWELKATFQSSARPIEDNAHWLRQIMAQCYVVGATCAKLTRLEIMGDWKSIFKPRDFKNWSGEEKSRYLAEHRKPSLTAYHLEFTQDEIERNWKWLTERRDLFLKLLENGKLLPKAVALPSGGDWECGFCKFREKCENDLKA